ncbi:hypothetical protein Q8F55_006224 [Vanrija albida]|uniref:F-box domain-containing protein n=1 Tax=Vanrija albida TaxID=181172 RepID=A0ABR3PWG8_9TREE
MPAPPDPLHLPNEVLAAIVDAAAADQPTLAALMRVCRVTYTLAAPRLYSNLSITDRNLPSVFTGLMDGAGGEWSSASSREASPELVEQYPSPESDKRKRALLAHTTALRVLGVPEADTARVVPCPINRGVFPAIRTVVVSTLIPYHHKRPKVA